MIIVLSQKRSEMIIIINPSTKSTMVLEEYLGDASEDADDIIVVTSVNKA